MGAILEVLRQVGGRAASAEVYELIKEAKIAQAEDLRTVQRSGETRFVKEVRFARMELVGAGLLLKGGSGDWSLSDLGCRTVLTPSNARILVRSRRHGFSLPSGENVPGRNRRIPGPVPRAWTAIVERKLGVPACTYVMRFGDSDVWKIGFATNMRIRLACINAHVPVELIGLSWRTFLQQRWDSEQLAYNMEQRVLKLLSKHRTHGERVRCTPDAVAGAWQTALLSVCQVS